MRNLRKFISILLIIAGLSFLSKKGIDKYKNYRENEDISIRSDEILKEVKESKKDEKNNPISTIVNKDTKELSDFEGEKKEVYKEYIYRLNDEFQNNDIVAKLVFPKINLDYMVVKSSDNIDYLNMDINGDYSEQGSIFLDKDNSSDFSDYNSIIYGHKMADGQMFGKLNKFLDPAFVNNGEENVFLLITNSGENYYRLIASLVIPNSKDIIPLKSITKEFANDILNNSYVDYPTDDVSINDQIVTLVTCMPENGRINDDKRIALVGVKIY